MNLLFDRVYVINLKRRPDKLKHAMDQLAQHDILGSIPIEVIPGVDGKTEINAFCNLYYANFKFK